jgi:hypothetical protein
MLGYVMKAPHVAQSLPNEESVTLIGKNHCPFSVFAEPVDSLQSERPGSIPWLPSLGRRALFFNSNGEGSDI